MEKELYDYINSKLIELQAYGISYSGDEINKIYQNILGSYKTIEEMKKKVDQLFKKALETKKKESLNEKAKKSEYSNFDSIKEVINFLSSSSIGSLIKLYGGSVPYLLTNKIPKRLIGDIDLSVSIDNMDKVREFISKNSDKIKVVIDTTDYDDKDFGLELLINGINVSIFPYLITKEGRISNTFDYDQSTDEIHLKSKLFYGLTLENTTIVSSYNNLKMECPEYIYIQKCIALREKDRIDIEILKEIIDYKKVDALKKSTRKPDILYSRIIKINSESVKEK